MAMTHKERLRAAIEHRQPDRTPKGDLAIENNLLKALIGLDAYGQLDPRQRLLKAWQMLGADLVDIHQFPMQQIGQTDDGLAIYRSVLGDEHVITDGSSHLHKPAISSICEVDGYRSPDPSTCLTDTLDWFVANSDLFVFGQIMGSVSSLDWMLGTEDYMIYSMTETESIKILTEKVMAYEIARAKIFIDHGADGIMITDDIAFNTGLFMPPHIMDELAWPFYKKIIQEIKAHRDVPVFLHTDGDIRKVMGNIVQCGFDGLQSLQPSADMDIEVVKRDYGDGLCLMGNMDLDHLMSFGSAEEVLTQAKWLCEKIGQGGGFILSTCNILTNMIPPANVLAMYGVS